MKDEETTGLMGAKPTKFRQLYKKLAKRQKQSKTRPSFTDFDVNDDDRSLLLPKNRTIVLEMESVENFERNEDSNSNEIRQMRQELAVRVQQLHIALDELEIQHNRELDECANQKVKPTFGKFPTIMGDPQLEECRLRNALLMEKLRVCHEQVIRAEDPIPVVKTKDGKEKNTFLRQLLVKTARRQFKKSRLNDAIETFYQLVVATNGVLCAEEAWLLFDICSQKIAGTYEFYHRIADLVRQLDPGTSKYIVNELWSSIVEDLRNECSELYDVVMSVRVEVAEPLEESCVVEKLKYLTTMRVCALWLQITPIEHDEFDDVKDLFYDSLGKDVDAFTNLISYDDNNRKAADHFKNVIEDLYTKYPVVSRTSKLQKIASKIMGQKSDHISALLKDKDR